MNLLIIVNYILDDCAKNIINYFRFPFFVVIIVSAFSIHCKAITVRDDDNGYDATPKRYTFSDPDLGRPEEEHRQEYYKPLR